MLDDTIESLKKELELEKKKVKVLEEKISSFENPGKSKLYYALNRNMNDLADMLNGIDIKRLNIDDPKDKSVDRLKTIWGSISSLSATLSVLGQSAGITGNEEEDLKIPFIETVATKRD